MSIMSDSDRAQLLEDAGFLLDKGYVLKKSDEYGFDLIRENMMFSIYYERYEDRGEISIRFLQENKIFHVSWLAHILDKDTNDSLHRAIERKRENIPFNQGVTKIKKQSSLDKLKKLLMLVKDNYNNLLDIDFCRTIKEESTALYQQFLD